MANELPVGLTFDDVQIAAARQILLDLLDLAGQELDARLAITSTVVFCGIAVLRQARCCVS